MRWEAVAINADFWSQVLQSQTLKPLDFALGAAILDAPKCARTKSAASNRWPIVSPTIISLAIALSKTAIASRSAPSSSECWDAPMNWREVWKHQLRWARTIRVCQPLPYFFSIFSNATFWPLLVAGGFHLVTATRPILHAADAVIALFVAFGFSPFAQNLQRRFTPEQKLVSPFWLVPVKDLLQAAIWFCAFAGNTVEWRGRKMKLRRDGTLVEEK